MTDEWQPIETAPKDGTTILVFGKPTAIDGLSFKSAGLHTAYWDSIDGAFCLTGATCAGPFIYPSHWMLLPPPPAPKGVVIRTDPIT